MLEMACTIPQVMLSTQRLRDVCLLWFAKVADKQTIYSPKAFDAIVPPYATRFSMSLDAVEIIHVLATFSNNIQGWWSRWTDWTSSGNPGCWGVFFANAAPKRRKCLRGRKGTSNHQVGAGSKLLSGRENKKFLGRIKLPYQEKKMRWMDVFLTVLFGDVFFHQQIGWAEGMRQVWMLQVDEFATLDLIFERQWARFFAKDGRAQLLNLPSLRPSTLGTEEGVFDSWRVDGFSPSQSRSQFPETLLRTWDKKMCEDPLQAHFTFRCIWWDATTWMWHTQWSPDLRLGRWLLQGLPWVIPLGRQERGVCVIKAGAERLGEESRTWKMMKYPYPPWN